MARNVESALTTARRSPESVAHAADIPTDDFMDRLTGRSEFTVAQLVNVGGVLRVPASTFLGGTA